MSTGAAGSGGVIKGSACRRSGTFTTIGTSAAADVEKCTRRALPCSADSLACRVGMGVVRALREKERFKLEASITHKHKMGNEEITMCRYYMSC